MDIHVGHWHWDVQLSCVTGIGMFTLGKLVAMLMGVTIYFGTQGKHTTHDVLRRQDNSNVVQNRSLVSGATTEPRDRASNMCIHTYIDTYIHACIHTSTYTLT